MNDARYRRSPAAVWRATRGFLVATVPPAPPTVITGSASLVWDQLAQPVTLDAVVDQVVELVSAPVDQVRVDVAALLGELLDHGLVEAEQ